MAIVKILGPCSYYVELQNGIMVRWHIDSIRSQVEGDFNSDQDSDTLISSPAEEAEN